MNVPAQKATFYIFWSALSTIPKLEECESLADFQMIKIEGL